MMDKRLYLLTSYVKAAMGGNQCTLPIEEPDHFFTLARQQGLSGMIYFAFNKNDNDSVYQKFRDEFYRYTTKDAFQQEAIQQITEIFDQQKIDHIFLKGAYMKQLYPNTAMRSMGDIDVLIKREDMDKAKDAMNRIGFTKQISGETHDVFVKNKVYVEVHPAVDSHFDENHLQVLNDLWNRAVLVKNHLYRMDDIDLGIYLLAHLAKHFCSSGVGIRQILDIGIWENYVRNIISLDNLKYQLDKSGLMTFYCALVLLNQRWFDIEPLDNLIDSCNLNENDFEMIESLVLTSGVHGKAKGFNSTLPKFASEGTKNDKKKHIKIKVFFSIVFPAKRKICFTYTYLNKYPFLLPVAWISRWFRWIFFQPKRSIRKIKEFKVDNKNISQHVELYQKIGL